METNERTSSHSFLHEELYFSSSWKMSPRIKFISVAATSIANQTFVALGTNNGSIYLFEKRGTEMHHLTTLRKEEEPVLKLRFSINGHHLASALRNGHLNIFSVKFHLHLFECVRVSQLHKSSLVCDMAWSDAWTLYSGDDKGVVTVTYVPTSKSKDLVTLPVAQIQTLQSPVVQIDSHKSLLSVSTEKSTFLFDTESRTFRTVGSKPRQGKFGACFAPESGDGVNLFCARPGYRFWQTEGDAVVSVTHQYKEFSSMKEPRIWGQPMILKSDNSRSGICPYLAAINSSIVVAVDLHSNFLFFDRGAKSAEAYLPCPEGLVAFSLARPAAGAVFLLLEGNRVCVLRCLPFAEAADELIASSWVSDAVHFLTSCPSEDLVKRCVSEMAINRLILAAGECDANYDTLITMRDAIREFAASEEARLPELFLDVDLTAKNGEFGNHDADDGASDISEPSITSSQDSQELDMRSSQKRKSTTLLRKMQTRLRETSERFRQEISSSETAQSIVKKVKDTTTKIKSDAEQFIVDRVNLIPPVVPSDLETSQESLNSQAPSLAKPSAPTVKYTAPALNFVELEAVTNICWERWLTKDNPISDPLLPLQLVRRSLGEVFIVMDRLIRQCREIVGVSDQNGRNGVDGGPEPPPDEEKEIPTQIDAETMTVTDKLPNFFPLPQKLHLLCGRIAVLAFFFKLSPRDRERSTADTPVQPLEGEKAVQVSLFAELDEEEAGGGDAAAMGTLEEMFAELNVYEDYGFVEAAFADFAHLLHADVGFWRKCLQTLPVSRRAFRRHLLAMEEALRERCVKLDLIDWSSVEVFHVLDTSMITEPMIAFHMLVRLFAERPRKALRYCVQNSNAVSLRDVFNILLHQRQLRLFVDFIRMVMEEEKNVVKGSHFVENLKASDDIFITIVVLVAMFENEDIEPKRCDFCESKIYLNVERARKDDVTPFLFKWCGSSRSLQVAEQWLLKSGYVTQYSVALLSRGKKAALIQLAFELDCSELVFLIDRLGMEEIEQIVRLMIEEKTPSCLQCGASYGDHLTSWSWPFVGQLIYQSIPTPHAVKLLSTFDIPASAELGALFQTFSSTTLKSVKLKSPRSGSLPGHSLQTTPIFKRCYQSWGRIVSELSECYMCGRLLFNKNESEEIFITPCCRNAFHTQCVPSPDFCIICLK